MGKVESSQKTEIVRKNLEPLSRRELDLRIKRLRAEMLAAAQKLAFERAAELRDELKELELVSLLKQ